MSKEPMTDAQIEEIISRAGRENSIDGMDGESWDRILVRAALEAARLRGEAAPCDDCGGRGELHDGQRGWVKCGHCPEAAQDEQQAVAPFAHLLIDKDGECVEARMFACDALWTYTPADIRDANEGNPDLAPFTAALVYTRPHPEQQGQAVAWEYLGTSSLAGPWPAPEWKPCDDPKAARAAGYEVRPQPVGDVIGPTELAAIVNASPNREKIVSLLQPAAPVAELSDPTLLSLIERFLLERDEALTPDDYSDSERSESARLILKQVNEFTIPAAPTDRSDALDMAEEDTALEDASAPVAGDAVDVDYTGEEVDAVINAATQRGTRHVPIECIEQMRAVLHAALAPRTAGEADSDG